MWEIKRGIEKDWSLVVQFNGKNKGAWGFWSSSSDYGGKSEKIWEGKQIIDRNEWKFGHWYEEIISPDSRYEINWTKSLNKSKR